MDDENVVGMKIQATGRFSNYRHQRFEYCIDTIMPFGKTSGWAPFNRLDDILITINEATSGRWSMKRDNWFHQDEIDADEITFTFMFEKPEDAVAFKMYQSQN